MIKRLVTLFAMAALGANIASAQSEVKELTNDNFHSTISPSASEDGWEFQGDRPAVVYFTATWCPPCRKLMPLYDAASEEYAGKVDFYKVDVDKADKIAAEYKISSIPTLIFITEDGDPQILVGGLSKEELTAAVEDII